MLDLSFTLIFVSCCFCSLTGYCLYIMACHREPSLLPEDWTKVPLFRETSWSCPPVNGYKKEEINTFPSLYYPRLAIPGDICKTYGLLGLLGGSVLKDLPANEGTWVWSLDWDDPSLAGYSPCGRKEADTIEQFHFTSLLGGGNGAHSSVLVWEIPWTEKPGGLQSMGSQKSWTSLSIHTWPF